MDRTMGGCSSSVLLYWEDALPALVLTRTKPCGRIVMHSSWEWGCPAINNSTCTHTDTREATTR
jgi:hypothetical protein